MEEIVQLFKRTVEENLQGISFTLLGGTLLISFVFLSCSPPDQHRAGLFNLDGLKELRHEHLFTLPTSDDLVFGNINYVEVNTTGEFVVADVRQQALYHFQPAGALIGQIAGRGDGPGELGAMFSIHIGENDSLYVLDMMKGLVSVFAKPSSHEIYGYHSGFQIERIQGRESFPGDLYRLRNGQFLVYHGIPVSYREDVERGLPFVALYNSTGSIVNPLLLELQPEEVHIFRQNGSVGVLSIPYARKTEFTFSRDGTIYYGWTDSLRIFSNYLDHENELVLTADLHRVPIPAAAKDSLIARYDPSFQQILSRMIHPQKPAFYRLHTDSENRFWILVSRDHECDRYIVTDSDKKIAYKICLPPETKVHAISGDKLYISPESGDKEPELRIYTIQPES